MQKIMFNDTYALTHAVLDGTKTMTRRIEKPTEMAAGYTMEDVEIIFHEYSSLLNAHCFSLHDNEKQIGVLRPRYQVGEVVAIAQPYKDIVHDSAELNDIITDNADCPLNEYKAGWDNKMFTRANLMPHHIKITDVRMERLQEIRNEDSVCEGIYKDLAGGMTIGYPIGIPFYYTFVGALSKQTKKKLYWTTAKEAYAALIDKISGTGTWERNPWVVVYEFEKVD